jgi:hypoxanthine phosphoribosyltransferase
MSEVLREVLLDRETIRNRVRQLGRLISSDMEGLEPCMVPVLDGGMVFAADLIREITLPSTMIPLKASSYGSGSESSGVVELPWELPKALASEDIILVDDILDTGLTLETVRRKLFEAGARSVRTCVLLRKKRSIHLPADYIGFDIPDVFVVGYGLDLGGRYRNLPDIGILRETA